MTNKIRVLGAGAALVIVTTAGPAFAQAPAPQAPPPPQQDFSKVEIKTTKLADNFYTLEGSGGTIGILAGPDGVFMVDTQFAQLSDKIVAAIKQVSTAPIRFMVNTHVHPDHTGGNDAVRRAGVTITGANVAGNLTDATQGAQIIAHENVLNRMSAPTGQQATSPFGAWPTITYVTGQNELYFNDEPIEARWQPNAHTDGDSLVVFRRSDVVATGDVFVTTSYPFIDLERGGSIEGEIEALNNILDIAIPKHEEEGGTYIIPGHGRICDEYDVLEFRDMVTIIRDRIQNGIKKGMTLDQIKAAGWTKDYDARWSAKQGFGTADNFVTSVYKSLTAPAKKK
jgi:cyclase